MCPFCFASLALTIGGTISMGGLTGLAVKSLRKSQRKMSKEIKLEENHETPKRKTLKPEQ